MVPGERIELSLPKKHEFESCASTGSAIPAQERGRAIILVFPRASTASGLPGAGREPGRLAQPHAPARPSTVEIRTISGKLAGVFLPGPAMRVDDFDYHLPDERIAHHPLPRRSGSRLLCLARPSGRVRHAQFPDLPGLLKAGDLLVVNDTRVLPARLYARKSSGGQVEILLERVRGPRECLAQVRASKAPRAGSRLLLPGGEALRVQGRQGPFFALQIEGPESLELLLERHGHMPLPPYIARPDEAADRQRYQTVYAAVPGAVAAPTAGLHFDELLLQALRDKGVGIGRVTLHVGAGTFQPVRVEHVEQHEIHAERLLVDDALCRQVAETRAAGGRVIAVGTTSVRALESAVVDGELRPFDGDIRIFIYPGYRFQVVDGLITNFHLPRSTLLMLVSALAGVDAIRSAYAEAIAGQYRFFSYGDAMYIEPRDPQR